MVGFGNLSIFVTFCMLFLFYSSVNCDEKALNLTSEVNGTTASPTTIKVTPGLVLNNTLNLNETAAPPQKPPPALGLKCNDSAECKAEFSSCLNSTCTCQSGYISSLEHLRCLKVVSNLGEGCSEDEQCSQGLSKNVGPTTCLNFICSCAIGMSLIDGKCQGPKVLNTNCSSDDDCTIKKSHCREGICVCYEGFISDGENNHCLPLNLNLQKLSGSTDTGCTKDVQCQDAMGDLAICEVGSEAVGSCQCQPGSHKVKNYCTAYKDLGDTCSLDVECVTKDTNTESEDSRICNNGVCSCNSGFKKVGDNVCKGNSAAHNALTGGLFATLILFWLAQIH